MYPRRFLFLIASVVLVINLLIFSYSTQDRETRINTILGHHIENLSSHYTLFLDFFETTAISTLNMIQNDNEILYYLKTYIDANKKEQQQLREMLYTKLEKHYEVMKTYGVLQFHFVMPNNVTSLRMHKPSKYDDNLTTLKYSFRYVNEHKKRISGLEEGKTSHGFRNVYPITGHDGQHLGAVDIAFAPEYIQDKLYTANGIYTHLLVKKDIANIIAWSRNHSNVRSIQSVEHKDYTYLLTPIHNGIDIDQAISDMLTPYKEEIEKRMNLNETFSIYSQDGKNTKVIAFLPLRNIQNQTIGYLISYNDDQHIDDVITDYFQLNIISILGSVIIAIFIYLIIIKNMKINQQRKKYKHLSQHDTLTNLPNRVLFHETLQHVIASSNEKDDKFALIYFDLDNFKYINDTYGHQIGDLLLKEVAKKIHQILRKKDTIARLGGDEFIILLQDTEDIDEISNFIERIYHLFRSRVVIEELDFIVHLSIGVSIFPHDSKNADELLMFSDLAMYQSKRLGGNRVSYYSHELSETLIERVNLISDLRQAIDEDQFVIYLQPKYALQEQHIIGAEALVRWQKNNELIVPDNFITIAEETEIIVELDRVVIRKALAAYSQWEREELHIDVLSLNLSVIDLKQDDFIEYIQNLLQEFNVSTHKIEFEITESQIMEDPDFYIEKLQILKELGFGLSVDDFGTGHSSLLYLKLLPVNKIKIDREFIQNICSDKQDKAIVKSIIDLSKSLNLQVVAEGIETKDQLKYLQMIGCDIGQGYYFTKPLPVDAFKELLKNS